MMIFKVTAELSADFQLSTPHGWDPRGDIVLLLQGGVGGRVRARPGRDHQLSISFQGRVGKQPFPLPLFPRRQTRNY